VPHIRALGIANLVLFLAAAIPTTVIMLRQTWDLWKA
jgi:hypothetical protein